MATKTATRYDKKHAMTKMKCTADSKLKRREARSEKISSTACGLLAL
jgi:hypothetical protein